MPPSLEISYEGKPFTRRDVVKLLPVVGGLLVGGRLVFEDYDVVLGLVYADVYEEQMEELEKKLGERYGVQFFSGDEVCAYPDYTVRPSNIYEANAFLHICWEELYKYPPDVIVNSNIKRLETSHSIKKDFEEGKVRGVCTSGVMNVAYEAFAGNIEEQSDTRKGIHHEIAHRLIMNSVFKQYIYTWEKICGTDTDLLNPDCFVDEYSMKNIFEDIPSTMAALMIPDAHRELIRKIITLKEDPSKHGAYGILSKKYALSRAIFFEASSGKMNDMYWEDLILGNVTENYWI